MIGASMNPVEVYSAGDRIEANALCEELADAGIEAAIVGDSLQSAVGNLPFTAVGPRVWVPNSDRERARLIIEQWRHRVWPPRAAVKHSPTQLDLKSVFILVTLS